MTNPPNQRPPSISEEEAPPRTQPPRARPDAKLEAASQGYTRAIDEIYVLRGLLAAEAARLEAAQGYRTIPAGARAVMSAAVRNMRAAAQGRSEEGLAGHTRAFVRECREALGTSIFNRPMFEAEDHREVTR